MDRPESGFAFLFRHDGGRVGAAVWWRSTGAIVAIVLVLTAIWLGLVPYANRGLDERPFFDPMTIVAYVYLLAYAFALIFAAIAWYNLSAKRFRDRAMSPALAGLLPFAALVTGAAHWLRPRVADAMPAWIVWLLDAVLLAVILFSVGALAGYGETPRSGRGADTP
jgi:uncharacterized membrane protein YhaH (DUF805 family)